MEENKSKSNIQLVKCSKCHKEVASTEGETKPSGFICNDCLKKKKRTLVIGGLCGLAVVAIAAALLLINKQSKTGTGFNGVGDIKDSMELSVGTSNVNINLSTKTAASNSVSTQAPISNLSSFKHVLSQNIEKSKKDKSGKLLIPAVSPLFGINTNYFVGDGEALVKEFASTFAKTDKKAKLLVEGFTCDLGSEALNNKLSEARAEAVKNILTKAGIPERNIEMKWYGKSRFGEFKYTDKSEYRRVTISVK